MHIKQAFGHGQLAALRHFGINKEEEDTDHTARNIAVGAAGLLPFAGMIGQKPIIHDWEQAARFKNLEALQAASRPGDILLTTKPKGSIWKNFMEPITGSPFYHAQPVMGPMWSGVDDPAEIERLLAYTDEHGVLPPGYREPKGFGAGSGFVERKLPLTWSAGESGAHPITESLKNEHYDALLMRPKQKMTPQQLKKYLREVTRRAPKRYNANKATGAWLKELLAPKLDAFGRGGRSKACEGEMCSTLDAEARAAAKAPGATTAKAPRDVLPTDYLRSGEFEMVGRAMKNPKAYRAMSPELRKALPYLTRGGIGLGLAGATYATSEDPALAAIPLGAIGAHHLMTKFVKDYGTANRPFTMATLKRLMESGKNKEDWAFVKNYGKRSLPALAAGMGLAYAGGKGIEHLLHRGDD